MLKALVHIGKIGKILAGTHDPDPYTGKTIRFVIGRVSEIDLDHVVEVAEA